MNTIGFNTIQDAWDFGFGKVSLRSLVDIAPVELLPAVLLANLPQIILSFLYLTYNGLYTCVLSAQEWTRFANSRIHLRVTSPRGNQQSTYYLQLPYSYAIVSTPYSWLWNLVWPRPAVTPFIGLPSLADVAIIISCSNRHIHSRREFDSNRLDFDYWVLLHCHILRHHRGLSCCRCGAS